MELLFGDCLDRLKDVSDNSVDLVMCDLPYATTDNAWDILIDIDKLWVELKRVGKPNTPYFFFCNMRLASEIIASNKKWFKYDLVWYKTRASNALNARKRFLPTHENIIVFYNKPPVYNYLKYHTIESIKERKAINGRCFKEKANATFQYNYYDPRLPHSVIEQINIRNKNLHPTSKPVPLLETLIKYHSNDGDLILDPTMGGGSTGEACINLNRRFIGIEKDEHWYNHCKIRLNASLSV
jgi:site-specific DNA-methyltransferase (adenine-specific)